MHSTLRLLGGVSLEAGGTSVKGRAGQRNRLALLALVAASPAGVSRDRLVALLWPEAEPERARHLLSHSLYVLRQALGEDALMVGGDAVRLNPAAVWCDVQEFERALGAGDYLRAVELYPGPFLDGFHLADNVVFELWVDGERERLGQAYARALQTLAAERESAGNPSDAAPWWRRLAAHDPQNSRTAIRLVRALEASGDIAGALRVALAHEALLREDLGLGPPEQLVREIERLKREHAGQATGLGTMPPAPPLDAIPVTSRATAPTTTGQALYPSPRRRWWLLLSAATVAVVLAVTAIVLRRSEAGAPLDSNLVAIAPFDAVGGELELWREGLVDLLSRNLDGAGSFRTVSPSVVVHRWNGRADPASALVLGRRIGAGLIVFGNLASVGPDSVHLAASLLDVARRRTIGEAQVRGPADHLAQLADSLTIGLLRELGRTRDVLAVRTAGLPATTLPALKAFLEGERLYRRASWDSAQAAYLRALAHDSTFVPAMRHLGWSFGWRSAGSHEAGPYYLRAGELNHGLPRRDSLLVLADSVLSALAGSLYRPDVYLPAAFRWSLRERLFATLEEAARLYPEDPEIWYALGEARYHFGWEKRVTRVQMLEAFERSIALDSSFTPAYEHAKTLGLALHGLEGWYRFARPYLRHPATDDHGGTRLLKMMFEANPSLAAHTQSVIDTATRDELFSAMLNSWDFPDTAEATVRLGRALLSARGHSSGFAEKAEMREQVLVAALAKHGHLREAQALIERGVTLGAIPSVPAGIALVGRSAPESVDATFRRWLRRGSFWPPGEWPAGGPPGPMSWALSWWSARGDTLALAEYGRRADSAQRATARPIWKENAQYLAEAARAYLVLARGDTAAALRFFQRPNDFVFPWARVTEAEILSRMGRDAEALQLFEEAYPLLWFWGPTRVLARLEAARAAERLGQNKRAAAHYQFVVDAWRHADPALEPYLREARAGLERLAAED
jgi:DNA-binding SARP family transcriptional activator